jgi:hypothetical protein
MARPEEMLLPRGIHLSNAPGVGGGRSCQASQHYAPGELISSFDRPLFVLPEGTRARNTCNWCLNPEGANNRLHACSSCKVVAYCNSSCQSAHWKDIHRRECKAFARVRASAGKDWLPTSVRALLQVLLKENVGEPAMLAAFGDQGFLFGNMDGFQKEGEIWKDFGLQAMAAVAYGGLAQTRYALAT